MVFITFPRRTALVLCCFFSLVSVHATSLAEDPWADGVVSYNAIDPVPGFATLEHVLGEPVGGSVYAASNSKTYSVGRPGPAPGSYLLLKFNTPVEDHPDNLMGYDFIVYSNSFWAGGDPYRKWCEPALIEISEDVNANGVPDDPWYVIPGSRNLNRGVLPQGIPNPTPSLAGNVLNPNTNGTEYDWGYAELTPTLQKYLDSFMRPDDPFTVGLTDRSGGGDAFDIRWAVPVDETGLPEGITRFHFLRVSAFINMVDSVLGTVSPEISGASTVARDMDTDGDGILDDYELRVSGTDPNRPESTVLALEIPQEYGGSPAGTLLGEAADAQGNAIALVSQGIRSGLRNYNCRVDIADAEDTAPGTDIPGLLKSGAVRTFDSSESDFNTAQVQDARLTLAYTSSEIAGLDEAGLQPFRYDGAQFTQDGIASVTRDMEINQVTFRSRYAGLFVLASVAGDGDIAGGSGVVILRAESSSGVVGEPGDLVSFTSDPILLEDDSLLPDGTLFTLAATLGSIVSPDADGAVPGIQTASLGGVIAFQWRCGAVAGLAEVSAISLDGVFHGRYAYSLAPGPATSPVEIFTARPNQTAPGPVAFITSPIYDAFGNVLTGEQTVTLAVENGAPAGQDARPDLPGHQVALANGCAAFSVRVDTDNKYDTATVFIYLYAEPEETALVGSASFIFEAMPMPLGGALPAAALLILCAVAALKRAVGSSRRTP
jgi:hypothetical protein